MENVGIFYGHLEYFTIIGCNLWSFGNVFVFWYIVARKIWQPWPGRKDFPIGRRKALLWIWPGLARTWVQGCQIVHVLRFYSQQNSQLVYSRAF
jgi:hypothetical protein